MSGPAGPPTIRGMLPTSLQDQGRRADPARPGRPAAAGDARGRLQHVPPALRRRLRRPADRQRHLGALAGAARGDGAGRRVVRRLAQLLPSRAGDARRLRLAAPDPHPPGTGRRAPAARALVQPGQLVPSNLYFTTSRAHAELAGARWVDVSIPEASDPESRHPFKGNIDVGEAARADRRHGPERIAFVRQEACLNMAGGQPFSLENLRAVRALTRELDVPFFLDATRSSENALFIQEREPGHGGADRGGDRAGRSPRSPTAPCSRRRRITSSRSEASSR